MGSGFKSLVGHLNTGGLLKRMTRYCVERALSIERALLQQLVLLGGCLPACTAGETCEYMLTVVLYACPKYILEDLGTDTLVRRECGRCNAQIVEPILQRQFGEFQQWTH